MTEFKLVKIVIPLPNLNPKQEEYYKAYGYDGIVEKFEAAVLSCEDRFESLIDIGTAAQRKFQAADGTLVIQRDEQCLAKESNNKAFVKFFIQSKGSNKLLSGLAGQSSSSLADSAMYSCLISAVYYGYVNDDKIKDLIIKTGTPDLCQYIDDQGNTAYAHCNRLYVFLGYEDSQPLKEEYSSDKDVGATCPIYPPSEETPPLLPGEPVGGCSAGKMRH